MSRPMNADYPLFIVLDDRSVFLAETAGDLDGFEQIDIENHEYQPCWDRQGRPQELTWHGAVCVEPVSLPPEPAAVLEALRTWGEFEEVEIDATEGDPVAVWKFIDAALRERRDQTLRGRVSRFFRGLFGQKPN